MMGVPALGISLCDLKESASCGDGLRDTSRRAVVIVSSLRGGSPLGARKGLIKYPCEAPTGLGALPGRCMCLTGVGDPDRAT